MPRIARPRIDEDIAVRGHRVHDEALCKSRPSAGAQIEAALSPNIQSASARSRRLERTVKCDSSRDVTADQFECLRSIALLSLLVSSTSGCFPDRQLAFRRRPFLSFLAPGDPLQPPSTIDEVSKLHAMRAPSSSVDCNSERAPGATRHHRVRTEPRFSPDQPEPVIVGDR